MKPLFVKYRSPERVLLPAFVNPITVWCILLSADYSSDWYIHSRQSARQNDHTWKKLFVLLVRRANMNCSMLLYFVGVQTTTFEIFSRTTRKNKKIQCLYLRHTSEHAIGVLRSHEVYRSAKYLKQKLQCADCCNCHDRSQEGDTTFMLRVNRSVDAKRRLKWNTASKLSSMFRIFWRWTSNRVFFWCDWCFSFKYCYIKCRSTFFQTCNENNALWNNKKRRVIALSRTIGWLFARNSKRIRTLDSACAIAISHVHQHRCLPTCNLLRYSTIAHIFETSAAFYWWMTKLDLSDGKTVNEPVNLVHFYCESTCSVIRLVGVSRKIRSADRSLPLHNCPAPLHNYSRHSAWGNIKISQCNSWGDSG